MTEASGKTSLASQWDARRLNERSADDPVTTLVHFERIRTGLEWPAAAPPIQFLAREFHDGLARDEFYLEFQPQFSISDGRIVGVEALSRWNHPRLGPIAPADFIAAAESTSTILELGAWALRAALATLARLQASADATGFKVSVNVSPMQINDAALLVGALEALQESDAPMHGLELEITESCRLHDLGDAARLLSGVRGCGLEVSLDDFGAGYASVERAASLPLDTLKIDRRVIAQISRSPYFQGVVEGLIELCKEAGIRVVAEGVETQREFELLARWGCDVVQGFLFSEPVSEQRLVELLSAPRAA